MTYESAEVYPVEIRRDGDAAVELEWSDGTRSRWTARQLRDACPCATCREKHRSGDGQAGEPHQPRGLPVLSAAEARPLRIESMRPVGNYAYNVAFSDGHSSGIYPLSRLHQGPDT
jgi:DUF971 family protein